jgi:hypothetical protein
MGAIAHATSLPIEEGPEEPLGDGRLTIAVKRGGNIYSPVTVIFDGEGAGQFYEKPAGHSNIRITHRIAVDNRRIEVRLRPDTRNIELDAESSAKLIAVMRGKYKLSLLDRKAGCDCFATRS